MNWLSGHFRKQAQMILDNDIYALFNVVMLVILPYTGWLAASVIALVTLRKDFKTGGLLAIAGCFTNYFMLKSSIGVNQAAIGSLLSFAPCFFAAVTLRITTSWRAVAGILFLQVLFAMVVLQALCPEFIIQQYLHMRALISQLQLDDTLWMLNQNADNATQKLFANYFVGIQAAGVVLGSIVSLFIARYIQSQLYYPQGFKLEMKALRADKIDLLLLIIPIWAAKQHYLLAIDVMPVMLLFFCIAGLSLWFNCMTLKGMFLPMTTLSIVLGFFPHVLLPVCVLLGSLDTLFNFRVLLQRKEVGKTVGEVK